MKKLALVTVAFFALGAMSLFAQTRGKCPPNKKECDNVCIDSKLKCTQAAKDKSKREAKEARENKKEIMDAASKRRAEERAKKEAEEKAKKCPAKTKRCSYGCIPADKKCTN